MVDEDRIDGSAKNLGGTVQETVGNVIGAPETEMRGKANQIAGTAQNGVGSASDILKAWGTVIGNAAKEKLAAALAIAISAGFVLRMLTTQADVADKMSSLCQPKDPMRCGR